MNAAMENASEMGSPNAPITTTARMIFVTPLQVVSSYRTAIHASQEISARSMRSALMGRVQEAKWWTARTAIHVRPMSATMLWDAPLR